MKKRFIALVTFLLAVTVSLCGCSCTQMATLSFTNAFNGGSGTKEFNPLPGYTETLTYKVEFSEDKEYFIPTSSFAEGKAATYTNGKYVSKLEVLSALPSTVSTDIQQNLDDAVYHLTTEFSIDLTVGEGDNATTKTDTINSEIYFYPITKSFAPVYSKTTSSYTLIYFGDTTEYVVSDSETEIKYNQKSYELTTGSSLYGIKDEPVAIAPENKKTTSYEYSYMTMIDNAELLFALRNMNISEGNSATLPAIEASYGEYKTLAVQNESESEKDFTLNVNGSPITEKIKYKKLSYKLSGTDSSGTKQFLLVQKSKTENIPYKALPLTYAKPIITSGNVAIIGTLLFTLTDVVIA